jgi:hydrogenase nickel incorporation protein HypB
MERTVTKTLVVEGVLDANDALAQANREKFDEAGTYVINMMSAPGAGKTTLLERTLEQVGGRLRLGVLEGDIATTLDADRLAQFGIPLAQVNTDPGFGGECHLDANMVGFRLPALPLREIDILIIENVGNLVCPAEFKVGEDRRVMVSSVTEGEDKPLKYPLMFRSADLVLVNKIDLLPHLDFNLEQYLRNLDAVNPGVERILMSARTGQGIEEWCAWLMAQRQSAPLYSGNGGSTPAAPFS